MTAVQLDQARRLLCALQDAIRDSVRAAQLRGDRMLSRVATVTSADTIYVIDKISEATVLKWFQDNWPKKWPVQLVMEGLNDHDEPVIFPARTPVERTLSNASSTQSTARVASCMTNARRGVSPLLRLSVAPKPT